MSDFFGDNTNNTITGTSGDDLIKALGGSDTLSGLAGVDSLLGGGGGDLLDGGAGNDTLKGGGGEDTLNGGDGDDTLIGGVGSDTLDGGEGSDTYQVIVKDAGTVDAISDTGTGGTDEIDATRVNTLALAGDFSSATSGIEEIRGDADDPLRIFGDGTAVDWNFTNMVLAGIGQIDGSAANDVITGSDGDNRIASGGGDDEVNGGAGNDNLNGGGGIDVVAGGDGEDTVNGGGGDDTLTGGDDDDTLIGGGGSDVMDGGEGSDTYVYREGESQNDDELNDTGTSGVDVLDASAVTTLRLGENVSAAYGIEEIHGNAEAGTELYTLGDQAVDWDFSSMTLVDIREISGSEQDDSITGSNGDDRISSGDGDDSVSGGEGEDTLKGGAGNDILNGDDGDDTLRGNSDDDVLVGGAGNDTLKGGGGDDTLNYDADDGLVDGGGADDTLSLADAGSNLTLDITESAGVIYANIEVIDLADGGNTLILDKASVRAISETSDTLTVNGSSNSTLVSTTEWVQGADADGYHVYTSGNVTLLVQFGVDVSAINTPGNNPAAAINDVVSVTEDATTSNLAAAVLANDTDVDGDTPFIIGVTQGAKGAVTFNANGTPEDSTDDTLTYAADGAVLDALAAGESTTDTFTYTLDDGNGASDTATVTVTINGVNDTVDAVNDAVAVDEDATTANLLGITGVRSNDTDPDTSDTPDIIAVTQGTKGTVTFNANGTPTDSTDDTLTYTADGAGLDALGVGESTTDTFTYTVDDGHGSTDTATVTVTINGVNDAPVAGDDTATADEDASTANLVTSVLGNDTDADTGETAALAILSAGTATKGTVFFDDNGTVGDSSDDTLTYTADGAVLDALTAGQTTTDTFTYTIDDGNGGTDTATVTVTINGLDNEATAGPDVITLGNGNDTIDGLAGDDTINGGLGNDTLNGGADNDTVNGDDGDDILSGDAGNDAINGGNGIDTVDFTGAATGVTLTLVAGAGSATGDGSDTLTGIENIIGSINDDTFTGDDVDNVITGGAGNDTVTGGLGNDTLVDDAGNDSVSGGDGDDTIFASAGNDILAGEAGIDTVDFSNSAVVGGIDITLSAGGASPTSDGNDTLTGFENITGSAFDDAINGDANNNVIKGGAGIDILDGSAGDDTLHGGLGDDLLTGGGADDTFVFDSALSAGMVSNVDAIAVFEGAGAVGGDVISLDDAIFTTLTGGLTAANFVSAASAPAAADANDFILYDQTSGALFYDADGNGGGAAVQFATLSDSPDGLAFGDFTII